MAALQQLVELVIAAVRSRAFIVSSLLHRRQVKQSQLMTVVVLIVGASWVAIFVTRVTMQFATTL